MTRKEAFSKLHRPNVSDKVLLLTHTDMDAAGAEVLCKLVFKDLTVKHLNNSKMSDGILKYVKENIESQEYNIIIVDDISCSTEVAAEIDSIKGDMRLVLLDHHDTAVHLNNYNWAIVSSELLKDSFMVDRYEEADKAHSSGTSLMYDYLEYCELLNNCEFVKELSHLIAAYDTWDWNYLLGKDEKYLKLDMLCDIYGLEDFVEEMYNRAVCNHSIENFFTEKDERKLKSYEDKVQEYLENVKESFVESELDYKGEIQSVVWCFTSSFLQETFGLMKEMFPNKDMYIINYGAGVALRTDKESLHVGNLARQRYGGGGHPGAAGFGISQEVKKKCLEIMLDGTLTNKE